MSEAMTYTLPPLPKPDTHCFYEDTGEDVWSHSTEQTQAYAIAAIEAQGVPDGYAGAAAFTNVMPTVAIHFSTTEQALSFLDKIRASWDRQQRSIASTHPAQQAKPQPLSDERIAEIFSVRRGAVTESHLLGCARAIESAACADRDARIAELEQRNRDLHEDVKRFRNHALDEKDERMALERELAEVRKDADRWRTFLSTRPQATHEVINQAIDDAAMKGQQ